MVLPMSILNLTECVGGIVLHENGKKLVIVSKVNGARSANGRLLKKWSLPKGGVEDGETKEEALMRELRQEAGITHAKIKEMVGSYRRRKVKPGGDYEIKTITLYRCRTRQKTLKPEEWKKHPDALWVTPRKALELLTFDEDREFLRAALRDIFHKKF